MEQILNKKTIFFIALFFIALIPVSYCITLIASFKKFMQSVILLFFIK